MPDEMPESPVVLTYPMRVVLRELLNNQGSEPLWAQEIVNRTDIDRKSVDRILHRLEDVGWLTSERESVEAAVERGTGARRFWTLTPEGSEGAQARLAARRPGRAKSDLTPQPVSFGHSL
jgi:DNA-binding MarR family transcriptional regulator